MLIVSHMHDDHVNGLEYLLNDVEVNTVGEAEDMPCYFIVDVYIDSSKGRGSYDHYIEMVKPIVLSYGGEYLVRTESVTALSELRKPDRVIIIRFPSREKLDACFSSDEYRRIMSDRENSVDARAVIVEG